MSACEQVLVDLIHDLAQPLSAIQNGTYCLEFHVDPHNPRAQEVLRILQHQVERANAIISAAAAEMRQAPSSERAGNEPTYVMAATGH
jgi:signal transduction histidine kinase